MISASFLVRAAPLTARSAPSDSLPIIVPGSSVKLAVAHVNRHVELLAEFDRPAVHHAGPEAGQLQHLVVADAVQLAGLGHEPRIGRVHAVDIGVNFAGIGIQHRRQRHGRRIAAAAAERGDVEILVDPLEAGRDHDLAVVEQLLHPLGRDRLNAGLRMRAVGADADLGAGQAHRLGTERMDRHRHQRDAHLLAGREQHIHLAAGGVVGDLLGQVDQLIGLVPHRAHDHHDLVALLLRRIARRAAARIFSALATLVPPNF